MSNFYNPLPAATIPLKLSTSDESEDIVTSLTEYWNEADENRKGGMNPRDAKWATNLDLYWNRYDFSQKQEWQAKEVMPEVPNFVDRFAGALKEALVTSPEGFYTVVDPFDKEDDLASSIKRMNDVWLSTIGRNQMGTLLGFPAVFEEQMKLGALTACSGVVTWKEDVPNGRVAFETVDPRNVWLDHTYRNLYRIRRTEVDRVDLAHMMSAKTSKGSNVFNIDELDRLNSALYLEKQAEQESMAGSGASVSSNRGPVVLDEYIATVVGPDGKLLADQELMVVANDQFLVRGPEKNPFWHGQDWLVYAPMVTAPLSVYGRSYMEDFGSVAQTFTMLTNMIIDAVQTSALKAYAIVPGMLRNPAQALDGLSPNKTFLLEDGYRAEDFAKALDLGTLDQSAVQVWQTLKSEISEAAGINEIGMGQFAPKGRTSATEVSAAQQSSSALIRSVAQTIETRFLDPLLDRTWKTGLQHARANDRRMAGAAGADLYSALLSRRKELITSPITFQARGISTMIQRAQQMSQLLNIMQVIGQNENLLAAFMQRVDMNKFLDLIFKLSNVDISKMQTSQREQTIQSLLGPGIGRAAGGTPSPAGIQEMGTVVNSLGIGR